MCYIIDENREIQSGDKTGILFDGEFYPAAGEKGRIFIPFGYTVKSEKAILLNNGFA